MRRAWHQCALLLLLAGCNSGVQVLAWEESASSAEPQPLPWFGGPSYYEDWPRGFPADSSYFPVGVWMQNPANAARFQAVGVNHYIGLWQGPTEEQLSGMADAGMHVVCEQAGVWQQHLNSELIQGWLDAAAPDNAQENPDGSYSPCIAPQAVQQSYAAKAAADPTRPVTLMLGQGVATPAWVGRGECTGQTEDYPEYAKAADILVNYTYPLNNQHPLELVATGIDKLNRYANYSKPIFADLEASNINGRVRPTPHQLRAEVWMSLIHGAAGVQYFCHQIEPNFNETDCLDDPATAAALTQINAQLIELAPALNTQSFGLAPVSSNAGAPVRAVLKKASTGSYVFAVNMADAATTAVFSLAGVGTTSSVEVLGEGRNLVPAKGSFEDAFEGYGVHLYRLR
jgi:hypothetical protein